MKLGFIGLGEMGRPLALHLMERGYSMAVYGRRPATLEPLLARGATPCATPAQLAGGCDVVFTMLTTTDDVEQVLFDHGGVIEGAQPGCLVIDMGTISPTSTREFAARLSGKDIDMLDAPVSGGPEGAQKATLTIMVGGKAEVFERARPLLDCLGTTVLHMGDHGAGQATKACHQLALLVTAQGIAEALTLARRCGLDVALVQKAMMGGLASSRVLERFGSRMASRDFTAGIPTRLYHKDLQIGLDVAHTLGVAVPAAALTLQFINRLIGRGRGHDDLSALVTVVEDLEVV